jgi:ferredoxin--NADP+ reductase
LTGASRRLHLHFWHKPVAILGEDGKVAGMKFERTKQSEAGDAGAGAIADTGVRVNYPLQADYRAIGYFGSEIPGVPFDDKYGVIRNDGGRVVDEHGKRVEGIYATGWIKRGPVGLIGHTKSDAMETIENLVADVDTLVDPAEPSTDAVLATFAERGVDFTTWNGWLQLNQHEIALGEAFEGVDRERVKVVAREEQVTISNQ